MDATSLDDSALADTSMMDPTIEDLFGEAADGMTVSTLAPSPIPAALVLRVSQMQCRGCCTKLSWSTIGSVARIVSDGSKILFHSMVRSAKTAAWTISEPSKHPLEPPPGRHFVHITFSGVGIDLAAVDNVGVVHMYTLSSPLGRMVASPGHNVRDQGPKNELNAVVGMHWLPLYPAEFKSPYLEPAVRNGDRWDFPIRQRDQNNLRIHHPADGRNACLHITRSGELTLMYQNDGGWHATNVSLSPIRSSDDIISHADIGEDGADLFAVTHDCSSRIRLYRISVSWNATQHSRGPNMTTTLVAPALEVHHLTAVEHVRAQHGTTASLTHLRLIPASLEVAQQMPALPVIVAIFSHVSQPTDSGQPQASFSVISRWQIESFVPTLHPSFSKLKPSGSTSAVLNPATALKRQPDLLTNKVVLEFQSQVFDTIFAFGASDGSIEYRDRSTLDVFQSYGDTDSVRGLPQAGFEHIVGPHNMHVAMSADGSGIAIIRPDAKLVAQPMSFAHGWQMVDQGLGDPKPYVEAGAACIARQFAFLCYNNASNDESLALIPRDASPEVRRMVVKMISRLMNRSPDIAMQEANRQQMIVLREPLVPRAISAQLALNTDHLTGERNADGQFAFTLLNLRSIGTALAQTLIRQDVKAMPVETFSTMCGFVKWYTDLSIYIVDTVVNLRRDIKRNVTEGKSATQAFEQTVSETGNPTLRLLLTSFTRALLRFNVLWIGRYLQTVQTSILPRCRSLTERKELMEVLEMAKSTPFKQQDFEKLLSDMDQTIRDTWTKSGITSERRGEIERSMMCDGDIPSELEPAIDIFIDTIVPKLMENADLGRLFFCKTEWLGLVNSRPGAGKPKLDIIRKTFISEGASLRYCRRCGSYMEDIHPDKTRELPGWLAAAQRHCVCNNFWILID